ncbi:programmed cell death protein [Trifolium pratense]|uniref:Programmed cell death protein n=1 Tax=Trifolium pratense TaxID=57577 RepID=A0A2K3NQG8_TRIPR|nr:programmed cell death protein [Trifolium pratense]
MNSQMIQLLLLFSLVRNPLRPLSDTFEYVKAEGQRGILRLFRGVISLHHEEFVERQWGGTTYFASGDVKKLISESLIEYMDQGDSFEACSCSQAGCKGVRAYLEISYARNGWGGVAFCRSLSLWQWDFPFFVSSLRSSALLAAFPILGKEKLPPLTEIFYTVRSEDLHRHVMLDEKSFDGSALA